MTKRDRRNLVVNDQSSGVRCQVSGVKRHEGLTLLEVMMVVGILSIISVAGVGYYRNYVKTVELGSTARQLISDVRNARQKAIAGEDNMKWGIHFVNNGSDYYELFSTPTTYSDASTTTSTAIYLPSTVIFTAPPQASTTDVIFAKITGTTASTTVTVSSEDNAKTVTVTSQGNVY